MRSCTAMRHREVIVRYVGIPSGVGGMHATHYLARLSAPARLQGLARCLAIEPVKSFESIAAQFHRLLSAKCVLHPAWAF
jgi:hypothetical protein